MAGDSSSASTAGGSTWAILAAAGAGTRLGADRPKAFAPLGGRPLVAESIERLDRSDWVEAIVVAAAPGWEEPTILLAEELVASKVVAVVTGGRTRVDSVSSALADVAADALVVLVHDAARPFLDDGVIERVLQPLSEGFDGVVPALPLADTLKRAERGVVRETLDREGLVAVQTPQAFAADALRAACTRGEALDATDCASLVERNGGRVGIVEGDPRLLKVTTAADLALAECLLVG